MHAAGASQSATSKELLGYALSFFLGWRRMLERTGIAPDRAGDGRDTRDQVCQDARVFNPANDFDFDPEARHCGVARDGPQAQPLIR